MVRCTFAGTAGSGVGSAIGLSGSEAFTPADLAATIFQALGIDPQGEFHDTSNRPYRISRGNPIAGLFDT